MADWQEFESNATQLMNDIFNKYNLYFENSGGSNSTESDIKVKIDNRMICNIEAKYKKPQCGQITVVLKSENFIYSAKSANSSNTYTDKIIKHLNDNFNKYKKFSTASLKIDLDEAILCNWVKTYYLNKSKWLIYSDKKENLTTTNVLLIPIEEIGDYFTVSASFRIKKSGSNSKISDKNKPIVKNIIRQHLGNKVFNIVEDGQKLYIQTDEDIGKTPLSDGYFISAKKDNMFGVTKRNQTENPNPNVMFNLELKKSIEFQSTNFQDSCLK